MNANKAASSEVVCYVPHLKFVRKRLAPSQSAIGSSPAIVADMHTICVPCVIGGWGGVRVSEPMKLTLHVCAANAGLQNSIRKLPKEKQGALTRTCAVLRAARSLVRSISRATPL